MNDTLDRWIQRVTLAALLALVATLLTVGVTLYASDSKAGTAAGGTSQSQDFQGQDILTGTTR
ncbi:hypothetical protein JQX13_30925 [Archangium violaceum]|uniref:hypothetical protein n=1 Tax=Archangium violaceum TaxID=83451 RepID=UPI00193BEC42|nr:hypothetical protein [Archangium violaceum]QRK04650.1 hypothetical protein JQX13_30925 [Archangium violaceum]